MYALFSQWSKKYCEETLHEPDAADSNGEHVTQENHETDYCNDNKEEVVNWFNKSKVTYFICNWFSVNYFESVNFYPILVINKLRFHWFQQW